MIDNTLPEPVFDDEHYEDTLLAELKALPPGKLIADSELSQKHGLVQAVWLTVAMAVAAKREPVMVTEGVASGWEFRLGSTASDLDETVSRFVDQIAHLSAALLGLDAARHELRSGGDDSFTVGTN